MTKPIAVTTHAFVVSDVDDPDIYAAGPILEWQKSEAGQWMMKYSNPVPSWHKETDIAAWGTRYIIRGYLTPELYTYWKLKFE